MPYRKPFDHSLLMFFFTMNLFFIKTTPTTFLHRTSTKTKNYAIPWMDRPRHVTTNLEVAHQSWMVRCFPHPSRFSQSIEILDLFSQKSQYVTEISSCHHENIDPSSWKSWPFIIKFWPVATKFSICHQEKLDCS